MAGDIDPGTIIDASGVVWASEKHQFKQLPRRNFPEGEMITGDMGVYRPVEVDEDGHRTGCGTPVGAYSDGYEYHLVMESCRHQGCSICGKRWAHATGDRLAGLLWAMYLTKLTGPIYHVVISPPDDVPFVGWVTFEQAIQLFLTTLHGGRYELGYCLVEHLSRVRCAECGEDPELDGTLGPGKKPDQCAKCGCPDYVEEYSPHAHLLTNAFIPMRNHVEETRVFGLQAALGVWYVNTNNDKRKAKRKAPWLMSREALAAVASYELGHARLRLVDGPYEAWNEEYPRAQPAYRMFGLFNPRRWSKAQDIPDIVELPVLGANGLPFYKIMGHSTPDGGFVPARDKGGNLVYCVAEQRNWVQVGDERVLQVEMGKIMEVRKVYQPTLRLRTWADGTLIHYPPDGHEWVDLEAEEETFSPRINWAKKPELTDETFEILTERSDWRIYLHTRQTYLSAPTKI